MFVSIDDHTGQIDDEMIGHFKQFISPGASEFALSMAELLHKDDDENVIFSPISIYAALALVLSGARGESFEELATLMGLPPNEKDEKSDRVHKILGKVLEVIENTTDSTINTVYEGEKSVKATINVRNGIFVQDNIVLMSFYVDRARACYKSEICNLDFCEDPFRATDTINEFISKSTQQRIPRLLSQPVDSATRIILVSCIYFKATWHHQFPQDATRDENFDTGSKNVLVKMMTLIKDILYTDLPNLNLEAVCLDYAGGDVSMVVIHPKTGKTLNDIVSSLRAEHFQQIEVMEVSICAIKITSYEVQVDLANKRPSSPTRRNSSLRRSIGFDQYDI